MRALAPRFLVENRVQRRWESIAYPEAAETMAWALQDPLTPWIAFNDHTSLTMRAFERGPDFTAAALDYDRLRQRRAGHAKRSGQTEDEYLARLRTVWDRRAEVPELVARVAAMGRAHGAPMLSHDDTRAETRA
ncbi:hypothetical protein [Jannaschia seohaensis]|uniref:Alpha-D-ribose 1-methylphosphonate 5-triphosphate diphosphatase n=1 Tax=Jannaschia seohaensis TaxID=475081 RepID=A0A2Y9AX89_9RHOB|nr:hypothetical protein [Jannaschia seohaensis]PWJ18124.1 alpha-D-ribose 1-methylphosphonate 5-triphosphate diphosphatase [Jannaschia seohaensis]SSA46649.1 alpha-D-ribose 1-methylphosphonate 5-triphosphate diphosphatase [Jannaschia seohaensis]